jgi:hypothetical protein
VARGLHVPAARNEAAAVPLNVFAVAESDALTWNALVWNAVFWNAPGVLIHPLTPFRK